MPGRSSRDPTRYHCQNAMVGTLWSSWVSTTSPLGSAVRSILKRSGVRTGPEAAADCGSGLRFFATAVPGAARKAAAAISTKAPTAARALVVVETGAPGGWGTAGVTEGDMGRTAE